MKLVTYRKKNSGDKIGVLLDDKVLDLCAASATLLKQTLPATMLELIAGGAVALNTASATLDSAQRQAAPWEALADVRLCAPIPRMRKNVFCVGRNYKAHIEEGARARGAPAVFPPVPELFTKPVTAVIGNDDIVVLDTRYTQQLDYEVELAMVIGRTARDLSLQNALDAVFGYTIVNDISARDAQKAHGQWFKGKGMDTYCPIGPCIVTADEFGNPGGHRVTLRVNGGTRQDSNTSDMLFNCEQVLASLSGGLTLEPGDIIATGTPSGVALGMTPQQWLQDGDTIEAEVAGIGVLRNRVKQAA